MKNLWQIDKPVYFPIRIAGFGDVKEGVAQELDQLPTDCWFYDSYRNCHMAMIYTDGGRYEGKSAVHQSKGQRLQWTTVSNFTPAMKSLLKEKIFPLLDVLGRVTILRTAPGVSLEEHVDCSPDEREHYKPKFRMVLKGKNESLYFLNNNKKRVYVSPEHDSYIIDGSRVHGMENLGNETKYTLCIGAPWGGQLTERGYRLVQNCYQENLSERLNRDDFSSVFREIKSQNTQQYEK